MCFHTKGNNYTTGSKLSRTYRRMGPCCSNVKAASRGAHAGGVPCRALVPPWNESRTVVSKTGIYKMHHGWLCTSSLMRQHNMRYTKKGMGEGQTPPR